MKFVREHKLTLDEDELKLKELYLWFKDSAKEHILKIHDSILILEKYNLIVERVTSKNPGTIVYEDEFQISVIPFRSYRKRVI